ISSLGVCADSRKVKRSRYFLRRPRWGIWPMRVFTLATLSIARPGSGARSCDVCGNTVRRRNPTATADPKYKALTESGESQCKIMQRIVSETLRRRTWSNGAHSFLSVRIQSSALSCIDQFTDFANRKKITKIFSSSQKKKTWRYHIGDQNRVLNP